MPDLIPVLIGSTGLLAGESFLLTGGAEYIVGRSRSCAVSLQRAPRFLALSENDQKTLPHFNSVSRQHLKISIKGVQARLENLSPYGSWCNEKRFDGVHEVTLSTAPVNLRICPSESFNLLLIDKDDSEFALGSTRNMSDPNKSTESINKSKKNHEGPG
jgi:hypothetical protein